MNFEEIIDDIIESLKRLSNVKRVALSTGHLWMDLPFMSPVYSGGWGPFLMNGFSGQPIGSSYQRKFVNNLTGYQYFQSL